MPAQTGRRGAAGGSGLALGLLRGGWPEGGGRATTSLAEPLLVLGASTRLAAPFRFPFCEPAAASLRLPGCCRLLKLRFSLLFAGVFNHAVPSASAHPFGARVGRGAACGSATLGPSPLQAAASASASSFQAPASVETRPPPPPPPPPPPLPPPAHLGRSPAGPPVLHAPPPPNAALPPPPTLLASNPEPALLQSLASLPPNQAFLPPTSAASLPPANASLSIKLTSLPHKGARPSFTVHHQPLPRLALAQAAPGIPQASATGPSAVWVSLGMPPPYAAHLSGVKPR